MNSQLEWVPGKKGDEMVSDSGSQPLDTGSFHLMAKWPDTQTLSLQHCGQKLDVGSQLLGDLCSAPGSMATTSGPQNKSLKYLESFTSLQRR